MTTHSITGATFTLYCADPQSSPDFLRDALGPDDATMTLNSETDITEGELVKIGREIIKCGAPGTRGVVPITREQ